jgi:hypothetical protein
VSAAPSRRQRRWWLRAATGLLFAALAFFLSCLGGIDESDESWFMQVTQRVASGETLYRDVYFNATPLPVYLTVGVVKLLGNELLAHKAFLALLSALTALLVWMIANQLTALCSGSRRLPGQSAAIGTPPAPWPVRRAPLLLLLGVLVYAVPWKVTTTPLATVSFLACQAMTLAFLGADQRANGPGAGRAHAYLALASVAAGLSFCSKQNYGLAALAALLVCAWIGSRVASRKRRLQGLALILAAFAAVTILVHVPVYLSRGMEGLIDYGFANKAQYVRLASVPYSDGIQSFWAPLRMLFLSHHPLKHFRAVYWTFPFLLPFVAFPGLVLACFTCRQDERKIAVAATLFAGAGFLGAFPRCDPTHLAFVVPHLLLGLWYASRSVLLLWPGRPWRLVGAFLLVWLVTGLGLKLVRPTLPLLSGDRIPSILPHYRGTPVTRAQDLLRKKWADALARAAGGRPMFLLSPRAGFLYLASGVRNPTPFDYPIITGLGVDGQRRLIQAISNGDICAVGVEQDWPTDLRPALLVTYIKKTMTRTDQIGLITIYRR